MPPKRNMKGFLFERILSILDLNPKRHYSVLDFGCGTGDLLGSIFNILPKGSILVGIEARKKPIEQARIRRNGVRL